MKKAKMKRKRVPTYEIIATNGDETIRLKMSRAELCQMIGQSYWRAALASAEIEGEGAQSDFPDMSFKDLPEGVLRTE